MYGTIIKIRRLHYKDQLSQRAIASKLGLSRQTIKTHLSTTTPPQYTRTKQHYPKLGDYISIVNQHIRDEAAKPPHERLMKLKFFEHLRSQGYEGSYASLCRYIRMFKSTQDLSVKDVFIPQRFAAGDAY